MEMKRCTGPCGQEYPTTTEFWHRQGKHGLKPQCKECRSQKTKDYHSRPEVRAHRKEQHKDYYSRPEIQGRQRAYIKVHSKSYRNCPEVQERDQTYHKAYYSRPEVREQRRVHNHTRLAHKRVIKGT